MKAALLPLLLLATVASAQTSNTPPGSPAATPAPAGASPSAPAAVQPSTDKARPDASAGTADARAPSPAPTGASTPPVAAPGAEPSAAANTAPAAPEAPPPTLDERAARRGPMGGTQPLPKTVKREYVRAGGASGYLYRPTQKGARQRIGILLMHYAADYSTFPTCTEMAQRGYSVLCMSNGAGNLNDKLVDAYSSVKYLRGRADIDTVILWGHSGGATLLTAYQMIAENGVQSCQDEAKISKCPDSLQGLLPADALVLADSNWGNAGMALLSLDPAVVLQDDGLRINPAINLFSPANGYVQGANANYSPAFIQSFQQGVAKRSQKLLQAAEARLKAIEAGKGRFNDDEPFVVAGAKSSATNNKLFTQDTRLMAHTRGKWPLVHADGSITVEVVRSVRKPNPVGSLTGRFEMGALNTTVRNYLLEQAIRVSDQFSYGADSISGVEWTSSYSSTPGNITQIRVPTLVMGMTGGYEFLAAETIYQQSAARDKRLAFIEGASHMYDTCTACESRPGQYGNTLKTLHDYVDQWLSDKARLGKTGTAARAGTATGGGSGAGTASK